MITMVDLEITKTELEPQNNEWYHVKITFNTNKIISFFFKERLEITQYDPSERPWGNTGDLTYNYDSTIIKP